MSQVGTQRAKVFWLDFLPPGDGFLQLAKHCKGISSLRLAYDDALGQSSFCNSRCRLIAQGLACFFFFLFLGGTRDQGPGKVGRVLQQKAARQALGVLPGTPQFAGHLLIRGNSTGVTPAKSPNIWTYNWSILELTPAKSPNMDV